ncbi:MAG TPA: sigma factor-like helix-turn-helix DNA-binding protein [Candidatus Saccharimonadales bacterium]|nr:sigma factor-like helix-turn-helix DNA-binding protein [Candidatus Saccharimonadales bacterium]
MAETTTTAHSLNTEQLVNDTLATIDREREREIVARRFGLFERKETLEQIGELLGITRERVRQLEKAVVTRLKTAAEQGHLQHIPEFQQTVSRELEKVGGIARISELSNTLGDSGRLEQARLAFLSGLCPELIVIDDDDNYYHSVGIRKSFDIASAKGQVEKLIAVIKKLGEPKPIEDVASAAGMSDVKQAAALAGISKQLATLNGRWGLVKWPMVNPKNIRDKIYVILKENGKHMHFNEIADAIKKSDFRRKDVTTQAIHNELIKDKRFVLIGRGIYALKEWGYEKGTVADIITEVLQKAGEPLHRDEIVKRVLKSRFVKETTILLNLQGKPQFKRVAKATYTLAEEE